MKVLLVGPYPPPHGGISVHVYELRKQLHMAGIYCQVVNVDPRALESAEYISIRGGFSLFATLTQHARRGWALHVHTNGHNLNSWLISLTAGLAGVLGPGNVLTLHSGLAPEYLTSGLFARTLAKVACSFYKRIIAVSPEVGDALSGLGLGAERVQVVPAFLPAQANTENGRLSDLQEGKPTLATTLFFRPEYGFELLVEAIDQLRPRYPEITCLVMGSGEERALAQAQTLVTQRGLQRSIAFLGNVSHEDCLSVISQADVFVRPTLVDGDASSVREALALGTTVVASETGNRPPGVVLFRTGDANDLAEKIETAWLRPVSRVARDSEVRARSVEALLGIYESLEREGQREGDHGETQPVARHANS